MVNVLVVGMLICSEGKLFLCFHSSQEEVTSGQFQQLPLQQR